MEARAADPELWQDAAAAQALLAEISRRKRDLAPMRQLLQTAEAFAETDPAYAQRIREAVAASSKASEDEQARQLDRAAKARSAMMERISKGEQREREITQRMNLLRRGPEYLLLERELSEVRKQLQTPSTAERIDWSSPTNG